MTAPYPRLIVEVSGGCVTGIMADGIDLSHVTALIVDHDTDGLADFVPFGEWEVVLHVQDIIPATDEISRSARQAYDNWALCND